MTDLLCQYSSLPLLIVNSQGQAVRHNQALRDYWDLDERQLYGARGYSVFSDPGLESVEVQDLLQKALQGAPVQITLEDYHFPLQFCSESSDSLADRRISLMLLPLPQEEGESLTALFFFDESVTLRRFNLERRGEQLQSLARSVIEMKHEINNPLLLIIGHTQLLLAKKDKIPADVVHKLEKILNAAERIRAISQEHQNLAGSLSALPAQELT